MSHLEQTISPFDSSSEGHDFHSWYRDNLRQGTLGPKAVTTGATGLYLPRNCVQTYFSDKARVKNFLKVLFPYRWEILPVEEIQKTFRTVFAILLRIGKGAFIEHFIKYSNLRDGCLPFENRPANFPMVSTAHSDFFDCFQKEQWAFCALRFSNMKTTTVLGTNMILPILSREKLSGGGNASVDKITIDPVYDFKSPCSHQDDTDDVEHTYVLKTYTKSSRGNQYQAEVEAFNRLRNARQPHSLIQYFGSYEQDDTFNIILEYANGGTLEDFFQNREIARPRRKEEIFSFWKGLFDILLALQAIHQVKQYDEGNTSQTLRGWHQDIKPANILVFKPQGSEGSIYDSVQFKLSDLGLSHFSRHAKAHDVGGTQTYGAPECYRQNLFEANALRKVENTVDIWSLGCVLSEASYWLLYGTDGIDSYRQRRRLETSEDPQFTDHGAFHYNGSVLSNVNRTHEEVCEQVQQFGDELTPKVVGIITDMLYPSSDRLPAGFLYCGRWQKLCDTHQRSSMTYSFPVPSHFSHASAFASAQDAVVEPLRSSKAPLANEGFGTRELAASLQLTSSPGEDLRADVDSIAHLQTARSEHAKPGSAPRLPHNKGEKIPYQSVKDVAEWREEQRRHNKHFQMAKGVSSQLPGHHYTDELEGRDIVFIVDDSSSMHSHWNELCSVLDPLVYVLKSKDPDKVQLGFLIDQSNGGHMRASTPLIQAVQRHRSRFVDVGTTLPSMEKHLANFFAPYIETMRSERKRKLAKYLPSPKPPRPMSVYILTAGVWRPQSDVGNPIRALVKALDDADMPARYVSVQFIRFGEDPSGIAELERLDDHLNLSRDVVDTEPSTGNFWKMALGAYDPWFDSAVASDAPGPSKS